MNIIPFQNSVSRYLSYNFKQMCAMGYMQKHGKLSKRSPKGVDYKSRSAPP
jgi:hypothetical protein